MPFDDELPEITEDASKWTVTEVEDEDKDMLMAAGGIRLGKPWDGITFREIK